MSLPTVNEVLTKLVEQALIKESLRNDLSALELVVPTKNQKFGDFQSNHAFRIGRARKINPRQMAEQVRAALPSHPAVDKVDVAGPGFLNFYLSDEWLAERLIDQCQDPHIGIPQLGEGKTVVIDYSSPNVAKRMHIGHMRSTIIGNAIDRIYRGMGWNVVADNHIGDWGTQFGKLIIAWREDSNQANFKKDPIGELERLYVAFGQNETPERTALAREETARLQAGHVQNLELWKQFIDVSLHEFNRVYERLGIRFDVVLGESAYNDSLQSLVEGLLKGTIARESEGAIVVSFPEDIQPRMLSNSTMVIRKKDGAFLYGTTDLATLDHRLNTWAPTQVIYVTDNRQQLHFQQVFHTWRAWCHYRGIPQTDLPELVHVYFGMLKMPEGAMSTRKGNVIRLIDLLNEAVKRARAVVDNKSPELSEEERNHIAEAVGMGAIRYADLSKNPQSDVHFTWDKILSLEGNTAPFLMYGYARARGIQRKGKVLHPTVENLSIHTREERELVLHLLKFPTYVMQSQKQCKPNLLCDYLYETANTFNRFYNSNSVLRAESEEIMRSRLSLVEATLRVLKCGLSLLGIPSLNRM